MSAAQLLKNGSSFGPYRVEQLLGRGGMGEVYRAYEERLSRRVALKIVKSDSKNKNRAELLRRFLAEARTLAKINHPNVVTIYAIEHIGDLDVIVMEYVEGVNLRDVLDRYAFGANEAAPLFRQLLDGIKALHDNRVLHRDLKPQNLILCANGRMKILDFGIAKVVDGENTDHTNPGALLGTVNYLAPELAGGERASERSDLWSLGAIFFEMLAGRRLIEPPKPRDLLATLDYVRELDAEFPADSVAANPEDLRHFVLKLCARDVKERYSAANEAIDDLRLILTSRTAPREAFYGAVVNELSARLQAERRFAEQGFSPSASQRIVSQTNEKKLLQEDNFGGRTAPVKVRDESGLQITGEVVTKSGIEMTGKMRLRSGDVTGTLLESQPIQIPAPRAPTSASHKKRKSQTSATHWSLIAFSALVIGSVVLFLSLRPARTLLLEPQNGATIWVEPSQVATFRWTPALRTGEIEVARDVEFKQMVLTETVSGDRFRPERVLSEGRYHWRLKSKNRVVGAGEFLLAQRAPPVLAPAQVHAGFAAFAWSCKAGVESYRVQVAAKGDFARPLVDRVLKECGIRVTLGPGVYQWRVRTEAPDSALSQWSPHAGLQMPALIRQPTSR